MTTSNIINMRYGKEDLDAFRAVILSKLEKAHESLLDLMQCLETGNNETIFSTKSLKDTSSNTEGQNTATLAERQSLLITALGKALERVNDGTYGICKLTGNLISKERLLLVPHTEYCMEAKLPIQPSFTKTIHNKRIPVST